MFKDLRKTVKDALVSIAFFQIILTPYLFFWLKLSFDQYGHWCLLNMPLSAIIGPLFVALNRWIDGT